MIYYEKSGFTVAWNEADAWIETIGRGHMSEEEYESIEAALSEVQLQHHARALLMDMAYMSALTPAIQHKLNTEMTPMLVAGGLQFIAVLAPHQATTLTSVERPFEFGHAMGITMHFFTDKTAAQAWLRERIHAA